MKYLRIQELVREGTAIVHWIPTDKQRGNFFTKNETTPLFELARDKLMQRNGQSYVDDIDVAVTTPLWIMSEHTPKLLMIRSYGELSDSSPEMQVRTIRRVGGIAPGAGKEVKLHRALDDFGEMEFKELRLRESEREQHVSREACAEVMSLEYPVTGDREEPLLRSDITALKQRHLQEMINHGLAQAAEFDLLRERQIREAKDMLHSRTDAQVVTPTLNDDERIRYIPRVCLNIIGMGTPDSRRDQAQAIAQQLEGPARSGDVVADLREVFANITRGGSSSAQQLPGHRMPRSAYKSTDTNTVWKWRTGRLAHNNRCSKVRRLTLNGEVRSDKLFAVLRERMAQEGLTACIDTCCPSDGWMPPLSNTEIKRKNAAYRAGSAHIGRHLKPTGRRDQIEGDDGDDVDG